MVEIIVRSQTSGSSNLEETLAERILILYVVHYPNTGSSVEITGLACFVLLRRLEVWKNIGRGPPWNTPVVVILG